MCTCLSYKNPNFYFGRNLDLEYKFGEQVIVTPRKFSLKYKHLQDSNSHFAMVGMATNISGYPLYAEGMNEKGVGVAGLYFPGNALYLPVEEIGKKNKKYIAAFEVIQYILAHCSTVKEAKELFENEILITNEAYGEGMPIAPLHWMVSDETGSFIIECSKKGQIIYDNPVGVLTNNPHFDYQLDHLKQYQHLSAKNAINRFTDKYELETYGQGMGAYGLPGDYSPTSRFVKVAFGLANSVAESDEMHNVSQFFHLLDSVAFPRGSVVTEQGLNDITTYSSCISAKTLCFYFKTYDNHQINVVDMRKENLDDNKIVCYALPEGENFNCLN